MFPTHSTRLALPIIVCLSLVAAATFIREFSPTARAQEPTQLVPLTTDQTPVPVSNQFGVALNSFVNQAGDHLFLGRGSSALFSRPAGASAPTRVFQMGDEVPGFAGSRSDLIFNPRLNNAGLIAFRLDFFEANGVAQGVIFTFDGTSLQQIVSGADLAPGGGGAKFERGLALVGLNDSGDIAFVAPLVNTATNLPPQTTLCIIPEGGSPTRIAGLGDSAPGTGGTFGSIAPISLNNLGEVLFRANIAGGSGPSGLFVGSIAGGVRKVVVQNDPAPGGGVFPLPGGALLNNAGQVVFQVNSILFLNSVAQGNSRVIGQGDPVPAPIGGTFGLPSLQSFGDGGDIVFISSLVGNGGFSNNGVFRIRAGNPVEIVVYRNQAVPGLPGQTFDLPFGGISINNSGTVTFRSPLFGGSVANGVFKQSGTDPSVKIALDEESTGLAGGGNFSLANSITRSLDDGSVHFTSEILSGVADYGEFFASGGTISNFMNTGETQPAGARLVYRTFKVGGAGDFVGFMAQKTGGRMSMTLHNITTQATNVIASDGDVGPGTGGRLNIAAPNTVFINDTGDVVFNAQILGGSATGTNGLFFRPSGGSLTKIVMTGDIDIFTGRSFAQLSMNAVLPSPINASGQVVFHANLIPPIPPATAPTRAIFVWTPGSVAVKVAAVGDTTSTGQTITSLTQLVPNNFTPINSLSLNSSAQVAFMAVTASGLGIYIGSPGNLPQKVVAAGDPGPGGSTFSGLSLPSFNDSGEVAFQATLTGGPGAGVFIGSSSAPPTPLALNGDPAPGGGNFSFTLARPDVVINNQHDVAFRANLTGGGADSGYFIRRGPAGTLQSVIRQGQAAPGTTSTFATMAISLNNLVSELCQLGPDGDLAIQTFYQDGGLLTFGNWHVKTDNTVEEILVRGIVAPEFGGGVAALSTGSTSWNSGGRYASWARVSGGTFTDGIFLFVPTVTTNTPTGTFVPITLTDATTGTSPVQLTFDSVTVAGNTSLTTSSGGPILPTAFALGNPPVYYNLETTATFSGSIQVCIDFSSVSFPPGADLRLLHFENGAWVDVTTSGPSGNVICGSVTSLSPFAVVQRLNSPPSANAGPDQTISCTVAQGAPITLDGSGSDDPDDDSLSFEWRDENNQVVGTTEVVNLTAAVGEHTYTLTVNDGRGFTASDSVNVTVNDRSLTALAPANVWIGLKNSDDVGTKFDLLAEVFEDGTLVGSGQLNSVPGGSSGFNNAKLRTIPLNPVSNASFCGGGTLSIRLSVRIAADSGHRSGTSRLWYNDSQANSNFGATIASSSDSYFLQNLFALGTSVGPGPKKTVDVHVDRAANGNPFKPFGTWTITIP